jgi:hypothetical protein
MAHGARDFIYGVILILRQWVYVYCAFVHIFIVCFLRRLYLFTSDWRTGICRHCTKGVVTVAGNDTYASYSIRARPSDRSNLLFTLVTHLLNTLAGWIEEPPRHAEERGTHLPKEQQQGFRKRVCVSAL